jgi:endonuclease/exonuclease/phosphatase family metal-dependent hydrolase
LSKLLVRLAAGALAVLCAANAHAQSTSCRTTVSAAGNPSAEQVRWVVPDHDRRTLDQWCSAVGPAVVSRPRASIVPTTQDDLVVVTWNVHVGGGDVARFIADLREGKLTGYPVQHFVLLLQETYRRGPLVPMDPRAGRAPRAIQPRRPGSAPMDIVDLSRVLGLSLFYAPSMRNGQPQQTNEDRGNAILSTEPLAELSAIELPFERQRRVALGATIRGHQPNGEPWTLRLTDAHLENMGGPRRLWIFATTSRLRQAKHLLGELSPDGNAVLGGDLNTWFGFREAAYHALARAFTRDAGSDRRPTFSRLLRLDHLLFRLPNLWETVTMRLDRFGSDHHPLLARIRMRSSLAAASATH